MDLDGGAEKVPRGEETPSCVSGGSARGQWRVGGWKEDCGDEFAVYRRGGASDGWGGRGEEASQVVRGEG